MCFNKGIFWTSTTITFFFPFPPFSVFVVLFPAFLDHDPIVNCTVKNICLQTVSGLISVFLGN